MRFDVSYLLSLFYVLLSFVQINLALLARRYFKGKNLLFLSSILYVMGLVYLVGGALVVGAASKEEAVIFFASLGWAVLAFSLYLGTWSLIALRSSAFLPAHELIVSGPYKVTRHPFFSAIVLYIFGLALIYSSVVLVAYGALTAFFLFRLGVAEERELELRFKKRFSDYKSRTGTIFPRLGKK